MPVCHRHGGIFIKFCSIIPVLVFIKKCNFFIIYVKDAETTTYFDILTFELSKLVYYDYVTTIKNFFVGVDYGGEVRYDDPHKRQTKTFLQKKKSLDTCGEV